MFTYAFLLMAVQAVATNSMSNAQIWARDSPEVGMAQYVNDIVEMNRRQVPGTGMSNMNLTQWDENTRAACTSSLEALNGAVSNPSGVAVCYNLPFLDNSTGVFEADLRLFLVTQPSGAFANIPSDKIQVGLNYNGATVSPVNASALKTRDEYEISLAPWTKATELEKRVMEPKLLQSYAFVGQINKSLLTNPLGTEALQKVLVPTISLSAIDATGATVRTSLSDDEATFVNGVFAEQLVPTKAQLAPPIQTLVVAPDAPFVVPGLFILIFPIGLIITGLWVILIVSTIAYGTFGRIQYRDQFRELKQREAKGSLSRI